MKKQIKITPSDQTQLDHTIKTTLDATFPLPKQVEDAKNEAFEKIRTMAADAPKTENLDQADAPRKQQKSKRNPKKARKLFFQGLAGAAAAVEAFFCFFMTNPAVAEQVPIVEHVFEKLGATLEFAGDYANLAKPVNHAQTGIESVSVNGTTVTLSEAYCNETTLYLGIVVHSEEKIPETFRDLDSGKPVIQLDALVDFGFDSEEGIHWRDGGDEYIDGAMLDDHTFAGVIRFEMGQYFSFQGTDIEVPENFQVKLSLAQFFGTKLVDTRPEMPWEIRQKYEAAMKENGLGLTDEDYMQFTEEQKDIEHQLFNDMWNAYYEIYPDRLRYPNQYDNWFLDGPWDFDFEVSKNNENVIHKEVNDLNENGLGVISATKTPIAISLEMEQNLDYFVAILDAQGNLMGQNVAGCQNTASINGFDTSKIYVYFCEYVEYMDELKGYWWSSDYEQKSKEKTFKQLLDERSVHHTEITFEEPQT